MILIKVKYDFWAIVIIYFKDDSMDNKTFMSIFQQIDLNLSTLK